MKLHYNKFNDNILEVKYEKRNDIFTWGADNLFPYLVEHLIQQSVTTKACVDKVSKSIYGKSFGDIGNIIVNKDGQTLNELLRISSREYTKHNNLFIHVGYNGDLEINSLKVIPAKYMRIGKADDLGYSGKFIIYDNWDRSTGKVLKADFKVVDRYNPNIKIIQSQIETNKGIQKYKGQVIHIQKDSNSIYSLPDVNPVLSETILESNSQLFRSRGSEKGFLNTKLMVVQPFSSQEERSSFKRTLKELRGADSSGDVLLLESSQATDDLGQQMKMDDLSSPYNDKLFEYSDLQARKNISIAFGVPLQLIDVSDNSLFGNSGELLNSAKKQLWEAKEEERDQIEELFNRLMSKFVEPLADLKVISPFEQKQTNNEQQ